LANQPTLKEEAIEELRKLLHCDDMKVKLRAISLILRHSEKIRSKQSDEEDFLVFLDELNDIKLPEPEDKKRKKK